VKIYIQWTNAVPQDWVEIDSSAWNALPKKPVPVGGEVIDASLGWVYAINCQGVIFSGRDHYAIVDVAKGTIVGGWNDDINDEPVDLWAGDLGLFEPIQPDPALGGKMNTKQSYSVYAGSTVFARMTGKTPANVTLDIFDNFTPPGQTKKYSELNSNQLKNIYTQRNEIRHGILVSDQLSADHESVRTLHGWREWVV